MKTRVVGLPAEHVTVLRYYASDERMHFMFDHDSYQGWALLTPTRGAFLFSIDEPPATRQTVDLKTEPTDRTELCQVGEIVLCPPAATLRRCLLGPGSFHFGEFSSDTYLPVGKTSLHDVNRLNSTLSYLEEESAAALGGVTATVSHLVTDLLFLLLREQRRLDQADDPVMHQAAIYIEQHYHLPHLSLRALASRLGLSPSQLTRRFRRAYGTTPIAYCTRTRLANGRRLLVESDETLEQVAARCGYRSAFYFSRVFTGEVGQSPSTYRRQHRV